MGKTNANIQEAQTLAQSVGNTLSNVSQGLTDYTRMAYNLINSTNQPSQIRGLRMLYGKNYKQYLSDYGITV